MNTLETFTNEVLPGLLVGKESLNVLMVSYHHIDEVSEVKDGLRFAILNGNLRYSDELFLGFSILGPHPLNTAKMKEEGREAFERTTSGLQLEGEGSVLAVVYAGISAFDESVELAVRIAGRPNTHVVIVTCDCNLRHKEWVLDSHVKHGTIADAIVTSECGGIDAMSDIAREINQIW